MTALGPAATFQEHIAIDASLKPLLTRPPHSRWSATCDTDDAIGLAFDMHMQITLCERAVRVGQSVEHFQHHNGSRMQALRWAIVRAALALKAPAAG